MPNAIRPRLRYLILLLAVVAGMAALCSGPGLVTRATSGAGYPRIANVWGTGSASTVAYDAAYDLYVPWAWELGVNRSAEIRALNPNIKILLWQNVSGSKQTEEPGKTWLTARPGDAAYLCLLRDSDGNVLLTSTDLNVMFNMTNAYCRQQLINRNVAAWNATSGQYDGLYYDRLYDTAPYDQLLSDDIDANGDGRADNHATLDAAYKAGVQSYLSGMRTAIGNAIIMGNDAPLVYQSLLNGTFEEWELPYILDGHTDVPWDDVRQDYLQWIERGISPPTTIMGGSSEKAYERKFHHDVKYMPAAMRAEAAASYQGMRFSLGTALLGDGLLSYDFGGYMHGDRWWYDEYGRRPGIDSATLPNRRYLGMPLAPAYEVSTGVWMRTFENGLVVVNSTNSPAYAHLPRTYRKINGSQAPLFQIRVEDNETTHSSGWTEKAANWSQFGLTVHEAGAPNAGRTATYRPTLAYPGDYEVMAWIVPASGQSTAATYTVHHAGGDTDVPLNQTAGAVGWHSLGTFPFQAGTGGYVTLKATGSGTVVADAVKWASVARYNDGGLVNHVNLQPLDAIVLLWTNDPLPPTPTFRYSSFAPAVSKQ